MRPKNDRGRFDGRVVLVTGASSGFGLAVARAFAAEGADLVLAARNAERLQRAAEELEKQTGCRVLAVPTDVSRRVDVDRLVARAIDRYGRIDILVNNAGSGLIAPFDRVRLTDAAALFDANFFGAVSCVQAVLPHMTRQGGGYLVNVAALGGIRAVPNSSIYCASKAALIAFSGALRLELCRSGIGVTTFCPGKISGTRFFESVARYGPVRFFQTADEVSADRAAHILLRAVARRQPLVLVTRTARIMYWWNLLFPRWVDRYLYRRMPRLEFTEHPSQTGSGG